MSKRVIVVENEYFAYLLSKENSGYYFDSYSKGHELARESLHYGDAEKFSTYDIILIEAGKRKAEELRNMMVKATDRQDILIARYSFKGFWETHTGEYQIVRLSESFNDFESEKCDCPWNVAFDEAKKIYESLLLKRQQ